MNIHPIEAQSYHILNQRVDLTSFDQAARPFVARMIHSTADESYATTARIGKDAPRSLIAALRRQAPVIVDATMVSAGIPRYPTHCWLDRVAEAPPGSTRSARALTLAAAAYPQGAVFVIGNAPTALMALLDLVAAEMLQPAAVVGVPVGFVGAKESKAALWDSRLRTITITNEGERGGTPVAASLINAALRLL